MLTVKNNIAPEIMKELFAPKMSPYDLRNNNLFIRRRVNSLWHSTELLSYLGPKIWDLIPNEIRESESLNAFKFKIKRWVPEGFPCRICKIHLGQVRFIITYKTVFWWSEIICYHYHHCMQVLCHFRLNLCVAINHFVISFIKLSWL